MAPRHHFLSLSSIPLRLPLFWLSWAPLLLQLDSMPPSASPLSSSLSSPLSSALSSLSPVIIRRNYVSDQSRTKWRTALSRRTTSPWPLPLLWRRVPRRRRERRRECRWFPVKARRKRQAAPESAFQRRFLDRFLSRILLTNMKEPMATRETSFIYDTKHARCVWEVWKCVWTVEGEELEKGGSKRKLYLTPLVRNLERSPTSNKGSLDNWFEM